MKKTMKILAVIMAIILCIPGTAAFAEGSTLKSGAPALEPDKNGIIKIQDHLYEVSFDHLDYANAAKVFGDGTVEPAAAGCSSVRNGNYYGRNLDWFYDDGAEIVVHTAAEEDRYATLGVVGAVSKFTCTAMEDGSMAELKDVIPFAIVDGINEKGLFMNVNVVPGTDLTGELANTAAEPEGEVEEEIDSGLLVRFVLDHFATAEEAIEYLQQHTRILMNETVSKLGFETHYMIGDEFHTYIVEIIGNKVVAQCADRDSGSNIAGRPIMTNFYLNLPEVKFREDGSVTINHDGKPNKSGITPHGAGLERYNLAVKEYSGADTFLGMLKLMTDLHYTRTYNVYLEDFWYSEFVGGNLNNSSPIEDFPSKETILGYYANRDRSAGVNSIWITSHTSVYDVKSRELYITVQEEMTGYRFTLA